MAGQGREKQVTPAEERVRLPAVAGVSGRPRGMRNEGKGKAESLGTQGVVCCAAMNSEPGSLGSKY